MKVGTTGVHMSSAQMNAAMKTLIINYGLTLKEGTSCAQKIQYDKIKCKRFVDGIEDTYLF